MKHLVSGLCLALMLTSCARTPIPHEKPPPQREQPDFRKYCGRFGAPKKLRDFGETYYLPHEGYLLEYRGAWKLALWSAHFVPASQLELTLESKYHRPKWKAEKLLPEAVRARDEDYPEGGIPWNRGHLVPNADFGSKAGRDGTFILSNAVPQFHTHNQRIWETLEGYVREWVISRERAHIFTGGFVEDGKTPELMGEGVVIPTHLFKIVLAPGAEGKWETIAVVLENRDYPPDPGGGYRQSLRAGLRSIDWIEAHTGLNFLSALAETSTEARALETDAAVDLW